MDQRSFERCARRLNCNWLLIGGWLRRKAARQFAADNSAAAVGLLARTAVTTRDRTLRQIAWAVVERAEKPAVIAAVCEAWMETRHADLASLLVARQWMPPSPPQLKVLTTLLAGQGDRLNAATVELVAPLVGAASDADPEIARQAREVLPKLKKPEAIDELCRLVVDRDSQPAREAAMAGRFVPRGELARAVFFLLTDQWERYDEFDFDRHLLRSAFLAAPTDVRQRLLAQLRAAGRADLLTSAVGLGDTRIAAGTLPEPELRVVISMLEKHQEWAKVWGLVFETPLVWSARLVRMLGEAGWQPDRDDARETFAQLRELLAQGLPEKPESLSAVLPPAVCLAHARVVGNVNAVAFARDRQVIAIGTGHRRLALWNFQRGKLEWTHSGFEHSIGRVAFGEGGVLLCGERTNGSDSCGLHACTEDEVRRFGQHDGSITGLEAVDGTMVLSTGRDQRVALWDLAAGRCVNSRELSFWARGLKLSPDGKRAVLSHSGVAILDLPSLEVYQDGDDAFAGVARSVCFSPDGKVVIAGKMNGKLLALPVNGQFRQRARSIAIDHQGEEITGLCSLSGRAVVLSSDARGNVRFTNWPQGAAVGHVLVEGQRLTSLNVSDDEAFMVTGDSDEKIAFWDIRGLELPILLSRPLASATPSHLSVAASFRQVKELPELAKNALTFLEVLLRYRFRYDIEIDEIAAIQPGEFDIEIQG